MQQLKQLLMISVSYSLIGCAGGPNIEVCISSPKEGFFRCYNSITQKMRFMNFTDTENYICVSPTDEKTLLDYCKQQKGDSK